MTDIFGDFLVLYQILFSPQVKRNMILSNKHGIYKLPNDLRLRILGNWKRSGKSQNITTL